VTDDHDQADAAADAVRRLLAEARHDAPMPADVAARMDRVLADLATTPAGAGEPEVELSADPRADESLPATGAVVTRLPVARRRRAALLLGAAAAIVVGGVVLAQNLPTGGTASQTAGSAASSEGDQYAAGGQSAKAPGRQPTAGDTATKPSPEPLRATVRDGRVVVRRPSFSADALAGRALLGGQETRLVPPAAACFAPTGGEQVVAALYDRAPAVLVYHPPDGSTQVVDLVLCGSERPIRSVTLPAP
jgi:hypothetical protein